MKNKIKYLYLWLGTSGLLTTACYVTWASSCGDLWELYGRMPEGSVSGWSYDGMCAGDGIQFVGVFIICCITSLIFIGSLRALDTVLRRRHASRKNRKP